MIVMWRAWVLWSRNRIIQAISVILVFITLCKENLSDMMSTFMLTLSCSDVIAQCPLNVQSPLSLWKHLCR